MSRPGRRHFAVRRNTTMRAPTGTALIWAGGAVAAGGGFLLANGAWLNLPPEVIVVLAKALPFVVGGAAMAIGAVVRRGALQSRARERPGPLAEPARPSMLDAPHTPPTVPSRDPAGVHRDTPHGPAA